MLEEMSLLKGRSQNKICQLGADYCGFSIMRGK